MNKNIVIIGQNEFLDMPRMLESLKTLFPADKRIWVLDRSTDFSKQFLNAMQEEVVCTPSEWEGRKVSSARNLGLSYCDADSDVMFLDGDRYIVSGYDDFNTYDKDILLFKVERDERDDPRWFVDYQDIYGKIHNGFYSCGLFMKREAINKVIDYQGELFSTDIEQYWGVEDVHLGDVCYSLGLTCDFNRRIRLHGNFDNSKKIPQEAWKVRIRKRLELDNVKW